ncbi:hypothetical protein [Polynucleobacter sp. AM-26B4]|uniref:hypothetical protein n=1 Tax=Polynucleobacter sp. AM-26B4 TaxID=2689103 RepID=UPI001C0D4804|nr:hypothetical protein [Polynucleobacter sp. AM-26B4]MBU3585138.1 methionyl-tRNA formyltransferase [Polynucleobacter sp. AM-26B4]
MNNPIRIVIATPHPRYDSLEFNLVENKNLEVLRVREKSDLEIHKLLKFNPKYVFFPHWSWIIPEEIHMKFDCVIFHMTDLPYGRGGSPLQNLIVRGHTETKLSAIRCIKDLDAGPIYLKRNLSLLGTAEDIFLRAIRLMSEMIELISFDQPEPIPQNGVVTEFKRRSINDGDLSRLKKIEEVYDFIRMLDADGYPSAFIEKGHFRFEFTSATLNSEDVVAKVKITRSVQ